jgi:hypothetical protein
MIPKGQFQPALRMLFSEEGSILWEGADRADL